MAALTRPVHGQLARFLVVGAWTVTVDFLVYRMLLWMAAPVVPSKTASFVAATIFAYVLNRRWTFKASGGPRTAIAFGLLYATTLLLNVSVNSLVLWLLGDVPLNVEIAFLAAQAASTTTNFLAMRYVIFTK